MQIGDTEHWLCFTLILTNTKHCAFLLSPGGLLIWQCWSQVVKIGWLTIIWLSRRVRQKCTLSRTESWEPSTYRRRRWVSLHAPSQVMGGNTEIITVSPHDDWQFSRRKTACQELGVTHFIWNTKLKPVKFYYIYNWLDRSPSSQ